MNSTATSVGTKQIDQDVIAAIQSGTWAELAFTMPQLERKLYEKVIRVLDNFGGKWDRKAKAILFEDEDAMVSVLNACETGEYVDLKKAYQFFETPREVAEQLVCVCQIHDGTAVLEPSAGKGALIREILDELSEFDFEEVDITAVELNNNFAGELLKEFELEDVRIVNADFLTQTNESLGLFQNIIMNPPFARSQDMSHVRHAYDFLTEDGRLVAVMSPGFTFRSDKKAVEFREWLDEVGGHWKPLPEGSFKASGTNVNTVMVVIDK